MMEQETKWYEAINYWLGQSALSPVSDCMQNNPVIIGINIASDFLLFSAFLIISIALWYFSFKKKDFLLEYRMLFVWLGVFLSLCAMMSLGRITMMIYPVYWINGGLKLITGLVAVLTASLVVKFIPRFFLIPTRYELRKAIAEKVKAETKAVILEEQLNIWNKDVKFHINQLKARREQLSRDLGIHSSTPEQNEEKKQELLSALERIKTELDNLSETIKD